MKRGFVFLGILVFFMAFFISVSPIVASLVGIPSEVRIFPGSELSLNVQRPFTLSDADGLSVIDAARHFQLIPEDIGTQQFQVRLFGLIPVKDMVVDVVPEIEVIPGGHSIGVLLNPEGLIVNQVVSVRGADGREHFPSAEAGIRPGDIILQIAGQAVNRPEQVGQIVNSTATEQEYIDIVVKRNAKVLNLRIKPVLADREYNSRQGTFLLGLLLEDPAAGVGTLSFFEPASGRYGALGHTITDGMGRQMQISQGTIVEASIDSIKYGLQGFPGEKLGTFQSEQDVLGNIDKNSGFGIFGTMLNPLVNPYFDRPIPVALAHQVEEGPAEIYTVLTGSEIEKFEIEIVKVTRQARPGDKGMIIRVTDPRLLRETGGIIQGMSGSPIVQNKMLVGAITHVFINDPTRGYANFIEWMVYEAGLERSELLDAS